MCKLHVQGVFQILQGSNNTTARINKFDPCLHLRLLCLGLELGLGLEAFLQKKWGRGLANQAPAPTAAHPHLLGWWFLPGSGRKNNFQLYILSSIVFTSQGGTLS